MRRVEKEEYKKQQNAYRLARCFPSSSRPVLLCTRVAPVPSRSAVSIVLLCFIHNAKEVIIVEEEE